MAADVPAPPPGKNQSESKPVGISAGVPCPPPPRTNRSNDNTSRNKRNLSGAQEPGRNVPPSSIPTPSPRRNIQRPRHNNGPPPPRNDMRHDRGRPQERPFQRDGRNNSGPGFQHNRGMNNGPMGQGPPRNLPPPPPGGRMNNGNYGPPMHHGHGNGHGRGQGPGRGHGPGSGQRIPPPPPRRNGTNGGQMHQQYGRGPPPPPPPQGHRMNQNYGAPAFQGSAPSFQQMSQQQPHFQQQQQQQQIHNGMGQQQSYQQYPTQGSAHQHPQYQGNMGSQPMIGQPNQFQIQQPVPGASVDPNVAANWSTHKAPTGIDYFYNSISRQSTYERPACLGPDPAGTNKAPQAPTFGDKRVKRGWTQHTDQASGKVYYYNGETTTWEKPADFEDDATSSEPLSKKRKKKEVEAPAVVYNNKAEAISAFKGLLLAKDISPTMKWNDIVKICSSDARWEACSTMGERKQALAEYQTKRANVLREEMRQEKIRAKDAFMSLLTDVLPSVSAFNASEKTAFQDIRDSIAKDDRFHAVENEERREELYLDFVEELRKRDERQRRGRKREAKDAFIAFLKSKEESGSLTFASTWALFVTSLDDKEKVDPHFVVSPCMSDSERQLYFADHVIDLQAIEDDKRRRIRDARRRAEQAQRDAFRETLRNYARDGKILPSSRWRNVEEALTAEDAFGPVKEQDRNEPHNIFDDYVDEWGEAYHRDKAFMNSLVSKSKGLAVNPDTKYEAFCKSLLDAAAYSPEAYSDVRRIVNEEIPVSSAKLFFDELVAASGKAGLTRRPGPFGRKIAEDSSEDEGEIVEDGEISGDAKVADNNDAKVDKS